MHHHIHAHVQFLHQFIRVFPAMMLLVLSSPGAFASQLVWTNTAGGNWNAAANWEPNQVPTGIDTAIITNAGSYTVTSSGTVTITELTLGDTNATGTPKLLITAGNFTITNTTVASNGVIFLSAGTLTTAGPATIGGTFSEASGTLQLNATASINTYNLTNGELRGANCTITNFNWLGGSLNSDALGNVTTIPVGGTLTISGATAKGMSYYVAPGRTLNNNGTATWSGAGISAQDRATINNNGSMTLNGDFAYAWAGAGSAPIFNNNGTLTKASGSGAFTLTSIVVNNNPTGVININSGSLAFSSSQFHNYGSATISSGTISFASSSGTNYGALTLGASSFADFNAGSTYTLDGMIACPTADHLRIQGATVSLQTTNLMTPSVLLTSGILNQNTNVVIDTLNQANGTWQLNVPVALNNYNLTNGELRGANCTITNFNWLGGSLNSDALGNVTTIPVGGTLTISGATAKGMSYYVAPGRTLNNNGTATWSGAGISAQDRATINNNGSMTLNGDFAYAWAGAGSAPIFNNNGTLTKASGSGAFTLTSIVVNNTANGVVNINSGSLAFSSSQFHNYGNATISSGTISFASSSGTNHNTLTLGVNSFADFNSGSTYTLEGAITVPTADHLRVQGATVDLATTNLTTPSLLITSGQLNQNTNVVVNTINQANGTWRLNVTTAINNYNMTNGEIRGANITITNFNWLAGALNAENAASNTITIPAGGSLIISSIGTKAMSDYSGVNNGRRLINNGTATWSGAGITGYYGPQLINNNLLNITSDLSLASGGIGSNPFLINNGTINLTSGTDFTLTSVNYLNSGTINFATASLTFTSCAGTNTATGLLSLDANSFVNFDSGTLTVDGSFSCPAGDHFRVRGMTVDLAATNLFTPSLLMTAGQINQNSPVIVNTLNQANGTWRLNVAATINNYNMTNGELRGANVTITNFNWLAGSLNAENAASNTITIPSGGSLIISSAGPKAMSDYSAANNGRRVVNNGTATWSGAGITGYYGPQLINNNLFTIIGDFALSWSGNGSGPFLINNANFNLSNGSDLVLNTVNFNNSGNLNLTNASINFSSNGGSGTVGVNSGLLNLDAASFLYFSSGSFNLGGTLVSPGANHLQFLGMIVDINTTAFSTPSLYQASGTVNQNVPVAVNAYNQANGTWRLNLPAAINNYNMTNGEIRGANVTITNFNWLAGALNAENAASNTITIPSGGLLNISSGGVKTMGDYSAANNGRRVVNNGTATWSGANITGYYGPQLINNNLLTITSDLSYVWSGNGSGPFFINSGIVNLASGTDFTLSTVNYLNSGTINFATASLTFTGCAGTNTATGLLSLDANSFVNFDSGALTVDGFLSCPAGDHFRVRGMTVDLTTTNVLTPSLLITAGQLNQNAPVVVNTLNQANGTWRLNLPAAINNYNMTNGELRGANVTITNFNWLAGALNAENATSNTITIPSGGLLNISSGGVKTMGDYSAANNGRRVVNNGTATWSGANITGYYGPQLINNNLLTITSDLSYVWSGNGSGPFFINSGTVNLASGTDFTLSTVNYLNSGTINFATASLTFTGCAGTNTATGLLSLDANSFVNFDSGALTLDGALSCPAGDHFRVRGMTVDLAATNLFTPSLLITAGQLNQNAPVVVNTLNQANGTWRLNLPAAINNYNMTNGELRGANVTITNFNWLAGALNAENATSNTITIPSGGLLNISSGGVKTMGDYSAANNGRRVVNNGTATWSGANITGYYGPQLINNNLLTITSDLSYVWSGNGSGPFFINSGTVNLASGTDFTLSTVNYLNSGTINFATASLTFTGCAGTNTATGLLSLDANSFVNFDSGALTVDGFLSCPAGDHFRVRGMTVDLLTSTISTPSLLITAGQLNQNAPVAFNALDQSGGVWRLNVSNTISTYNLTNGELRGANLSIGTFNWLGGNLNSDGPGSNLVTVASTLNIVSTAAKSMSYYTAPGRSVINNGNALWGGGTITFSGQSSFQNNGSWTVTNDVTLSWTGTGSAAPLFQNNGTFTKSAGAGVLTLGSTTFTNSGTVAINSGGITIGGPFTQTAGSAFLGTNFTASSSVSVLAGSLMGKGTIAGAYYNNGTVNPGASPGFINGASFTNTAAAIYNIEIGGNTGAGTNYDQLRFSAPVTLDGTLNVSLYNNYALILSNRFTVLTTSARNGTFANVIPPPGVTLNTIYSTTNVVLEVIGLTNAPLLILTNPASQTIWTPDPVTFSAAVSGVTPISFQWQFNGTNISGATNTAYTIPAVAVTNDGLYTLQITDGYGGTTNTSATLTVIPFANTIWWTNTLGGNWSVPANWVPNRIPNGTNNVLIVSNGTYTVTVDVPAALSNLTVGAVGATGTPTVSLLSGQSLTVNGNTSWETNTVLALNGLLQMNGGSNSVRGHIDWQLGTLSGAGRTVIATNASLTFIGSLNQKFIATNVLENYGTFNYGNDSFGNAQGLRFSGGAQLTNYPSGVISIGTAAYDYSGAQTPRSYFVNYGTINANSANVFSPTYISIDFINYGTLQDNGYAYLARGTNYGTFSFFNTLCEVSVFGDEGTGEYFSFENGTTFLGTFPLLAVGGYAQWNASSVHPGRVTVLSGSGGASFANPEFRVLKNYTQSGQTYVYKGRWTQANPALTADLNVMSDGLVNGFHSFVITNAGTLNVNSLNHGVRNLANGGSILVRSNLTLGGSSYTYGGGTITIAANASATFSGGTVEAQSIRNFGTNSVTGAMAFTGNTSYRNYAGARTYFGGGSFSTGPAWLLNEGLLDGFGGLALTTVTNRGTVLANDSLNRNLALGTYRQESGLTDLNSGSVSGNLDILGGVLSGTNTITGTVRNSAIIAPGKPFGLLSVTGNFTNSVTGTYILPINGAIAVTNFPQTRVQGTSVLAGTLYVNFTNGFTPAPGNLFTAMVFTARSGVFDAIVNDTYGLEAFYTSTTLVLRAENLLPNVTISVSGGPSQVVCQPFKFGATASDPDGVVTNLVLKLDGLPVASSTGAPVNSRSESDSPMVVSLVAQATDDRGGVRTVTQPVNVLNYSVTNVLFLGGVRTNDFKLCMVGVPGKNYDVYAITNLTTTNWVNIGTMTESNGTWRYIDSLTITNRPYRFYRTKQLP